MNNGHTFAILAYKESPHLQECIDSLKSQLVPSSIILCTSTPSAFLDEMAQRNGLGLFVNPEKKGIVSDWNFALKKADSQYVTLAHQDDIYFPEYSQEILAAAEKHENALIIFSGYNEIVCRKDEICVRERSLNFFVKKMLASIAFCGRKSLSSGKKLLLALGNPIGCPTVTFNKENIGGFRFDQNFSINMDWKAWYDLAQKKGSFVWVKKTLVSHRIYAGSETSQGLADNRRQEEDKKIFEMFWPPLFSKILASIYSLSYRNNS